MQPTEFQNLQFGNVITDERNGRQYIVQHIVRDGAGQATHRINYHHP